MSTQLVKMQVICHSPSQSTEGTSVLMTFNIPKDILDPPPDAQTRSVNESRGSAEEDDNVSGGFPSEAFSESTNDLINEREDLERCVVKRRKRESLNNDYAKRWNMIIITIIIAIITITIIMLRDGEGSH